MEIRTVSKYKQKECTIYHLKLSICVNYRRHNVIGMGQDSWNTPEASRENGDVL